ncbi:Zinc carboxypeptidase A 1, partial [Gryllus bimaculatus]
MVERYGQVTVVHRFLLAFSSTGLWHEPRDHITDNSFEMPDQTLDVILQGERSRLWRKTRSKTKKKGCFGVDGNRNFDIHWNGIGGSTDPCSETYVGPRPFSEPETAALRDYVMKQLTKSGSRIKLYLTFHSYASCILYPWGYTWSQAPNANTM